MSYVNCKSLRTFCSKCRLLEGFRLTIVNVYFCHRKSVSKVLSQNQFKPPLYDQMCIYLYYFLIYKQDMLDRRVEKSYII